MSKKILTLTITKKYFDLIASGEKKIEYRKDHTYYHKCLAYLPDIIIFHYYRDLRLSCHIDKIDFIDRPAALEKSIFITTKKCFAIHIESARLFLKE